MTSLPTTTWEPFLTQTDKEVLNRTGYLDKGASTWHSRLLGMHPALIVIDMQGFACGPDVDIVDAVEVTRTAMGTRAHAVLPRIASLLEEFRSRNRFVVFTKLMTGNDGEDIVAEVAPVASEPVIEKRYASAFFETNLHDVLASNSVDTVCIVGNTTSGCVRATAIDAQQRGLRVVVVWDAVFDRIELSHAASLLDLAMKYATLMDAEGVTQWVDAVT